MGDSADGNEMNNVDGNAVSGVDAVSYLTRSHLRVDALLYIDAEDPVSEQVVRDRYDAARTTITRTLDGFAERGWVQRNGSRCRMTAYGSAIADAVRETIQTVEPVMALEPFLRRVRASEFDLDPTELADASVTVANPGSPYAPVEEVTALRQQSSTVRELSSIVAQESAKQVHDRAVAGDATFEIVLQADVIEQIDASPGYREQFEDTVAEAGVEVRVYDGVFPFLVVLLDEVVALGVTNEEDMPAALVVSDDDQVRSWAEDVYAEYYAAATPYDTLEH